MGRLKSFLKISMVVLASVQSLAKADEFIPKYSYPSSQKVKLDSHLLGQCLAYKTKLSNLPYQFNRTFENSDKAFGAFIDYLGASKARKFDFQTGQEPVLRTWVLEQPQNSIDPVAIYDQSLKLNNGNIFDAVLTIHQLLRNEARYFSDRYQYSSTSEQYNKFFDHFIDIRGDLIERGPGFYGDHAGTWYRVWGTMLYQMLWMPSTLSSGKLLSTKQNIAASVGNEFGVVLSNYVELSKFLNRIPEDWKGKIAVNKAGGDIARSLMKSLYSKKSDLAKLDPNLCAQRKYLQPAKQKNLANDPLAAAAFPQVDLSAQMSPTLKQTGGTCYAYSFTAAAEAALYRKDQTHRRMSPDYMFVRVFANSPQDSTRLFMTILGQNYSDGQVGSDGKNMFYMLAESLITSGSYVQDEDFREAYETMSKNLPKNSIAEIIKFELNPAQEKKPNVLRQYAEMNSWGAVLEYQEPLLKQLQLKNEWMSGNDKAETLIPRLAELLRRNIPPIVTFYYDADRSQFSYNGGKNWSAPKDSLLSRPVWHAVVLQKVERASDGQVYLVFRDSYMQGTTENPNLSQIRIRADDATELITQVYSVTGPWDR